MSKKNQLLYFIIAVLLAIVITAFNDVQKGDDDFVIYTANPQNAHIKLYWKDDKGQLLKNLQALKNLTESKGENLLFAMNAGMYKTDHTALGLFIQDGKMIAPLNKASGQGNFYLQPNGIFYVTKNSLAGICCTGDFINHNNIRYATQSGPMLLINTKINPAFKEGSSNLNIRNGVGILPNKELIFVMSKQPINLYNFATFLKKAGCTNALYLDGFVSRTYLPEKKWVQLDGDLGVIIGAANKK
jgi:uncharacterized protein YigE (DUF2233 family)